MQLLLVALLLTQAAAQSGPSITDLLGQNSNNPTGLQSSPSQNNRPFSAPVAPNNQNSIGSTLGSESGVQGLKQQIQSRSSFGGHQGGQPQGAFGQKPMAPGGIMGSILGSMGNVNGQFGSPGSVPISEESRLIVSGVVEAFMHKVELSPGEKTCLEHNLATLTADVVGTGLDLVNAIKALVHHPPGQPGQPGQPGMGMNKNTQGTLISAGMDGAMKITSLITLSTGLLKNCVKGDALEMLKETGKHFIDMKYVGHRLLVSGVDIAHSLSDSIIAFEGHHWRRFGKDVGTSLRKVLLSNSTKGTRLPEGIPEEKIIAETTEGVMDGFFVRGSLVEITDAARPDVDIRLDLHRCIAGNEMLFKEIWLALWSFIAQMQANGGQHGFQNPFVAHTSGGGQPKWMGELMIAMMQVPMALSRCNIGPQSQQMMMEAIKSIQYLKVHFQFPHTQMRADEATKKMALAIEAWTKWDFKGFGFRLGELLRDAVLLMFPQQYSVDANGRLRRQVIGKSTASWNPVAKAGGRPLVFFTSIIGGVAFSLLVTLVAVRGLRSMKRAENSETGAHCTGVSDVESNLMEVE